MSSTLLQNMLPQGKVGALSNGQTKDLVDAKEQTSSPRPAPPSPASSACCLFWMAGSSLRPNEAQLLCKLHAEMAECLRRLGGKTLEDNATSGLVQLMPQKREGGMTTEDAAVRLGQLLCRWARQQRPVLRLRASVHVGELRFFELPGSGRRAHLGPVVDLCRSLALGSECDAAVHLSAKARDGLAVLSGERLRLSRKGGSYYAEAGGAEEAQPIASLAELVSSEFAPGAGAAPAASAPDGSGAGVLGMLFRDFCKHLKDNGVDTAQFGKGDAKSLRDFYSDVAIERDSSLELVGGVLRRYKEVIRIQLLTRGDDNRLRELRIDSQSRADGSFRKRDEKLVAVLRAHEGQRWKEALPQFFEEKFGLNKADQTACLSVDWDSYRYEEELQVSRTIPGITTTYKVHNVVVNVKDQSGAQLSRMGMPGGLDFSTDKLTGEHRWKWAPVGGDKEAELLAKLDAARGGPISLTPTAFSELNDEVHNSCQASLEVAEDGELLRKVRIIKVFLHADILAADHVLLLDSKIQRGQCDEDDRGRPLTMRIPRGHSWQKAVETLLHKRLGITLETQLSCIAVDPSSHKASEERATSRSYPGLSTLYEIDEVTARVVMNEVDTATLHRIGLPDGQNFSFSRWEPAKGPGTGDMIIMHWAWQSSREVRDSKVKRAPSLTDKHSEAWWVEVREKRRHLLVPELDGTVQGGARNGGASWFSFNNATVLESLMKGKKVDMKRARRAAREICNPSYTCKDFYEDITAAFPELNLYLVGDMTSGRAGEDEYQRTLGAMFSFFWLMRLHLDGSQSFCFGLDEGWKARTRPFDDSQAAQDEWERRSAFHRDAEWASLEQLLVNAGLLEEATAGAADFSRKRSFLALASKKAKDTRRHNEDRTLGMLVLTAIHDIMKTVQLLPTVSRKHVTGSFRGYKVGEVINDHDAALAYVLEFYPTVLPSFAALPKEQQESVKFTQSKMEYNMGWLVQAEAPPGALFRKLRRVVASGQASPQDLAFYFTHWFTDLAGAEPFPQEGCEKFVLKFPKAVLNQFLQSFNIVHNIGLQGATETQVYEDYLAWRWDSHKPSLGPAPQGKGAIARMRLVTMAQGDSAAVLRAFDDLPAQDREVLSDELGQVDIWNQNWAREESEQKGPAILVYYAPALMQKAGKEDPLRALRVLAEVFRQSRTLWPLCEEARSWWVSVRVDQLKELPLGDVEQPKEGHVWTIGKLTSREGAVQLTPISDSGKADHAVLDLKPQQASAAE